MTKINNNKQIYLLKQSINNTNRIFEKIDSFYNAKTDLYDFPNEITLSSYINKIKYISSLSESEHYTSFDNELFKHALRNNEEIKFNNNNIFAISFDSLVDLYPTLKIPSLFILALNLEYFINILSNLNVKLYSENLIRVKLRFLDAERQLISLIKTYNKKKIGKRSFIEKISYKFISNYLWTVKRPRLYPLDKLYLLFLIKDNKVYARFVTEEDIRYTLPFCPCILLADTLYECNKLKEDTLLKLSFKYKLKSEIKYFLKLLHIK